MIALKQKIKAWLGPLWWYSVVMFCIQRIGDVINIYTGLWLVPKWISSNELGAVLPLGQIGGLLGLPLAILLTPFTKFLSTFCAKDELGKVKAFLYDTLLLTGLSALVIAAYTWLSAPFVFERLRIRGSVLVWVLCGVAITSAFMPVLNSSLQGLKRFRCMGIVGLTSAPVRLLALLLLLPCAGFLGFFTAQFLSNAVAMGVSFLGLRKIMSREIHRVSYRCHLREMLRYTLPVALIMGVTSFSGTVQFFIIRQRLPDIESAAFYFCSRFSEMPNVLWSAIAVVFFPIVSEAFEKGKNTRRILMQVLGLTVLGGSVVAIGLGSVIDWLFGFVMRWNSYRPYAHLVVWMALTSVFRVAFACFSNHEMACRRFTFIYYSVPIALFESVLLVSLTGYGFFEPYLPKEWIDWMASVRAARLEFIVWVLFVSAALQFLGILVEFMIGRKHVVERSV